VLENVCPYCGIVPECKYSCGPAKLLSIQRQNNNSLNGLLRDRDRQTDRQKCCFSTRIIIIIIIILKKPTLTETIRLHRVRWFGHVQRMEDNRIPKRLLYMNLETTRLIDRQRNRWQDEVREDGK
jgi:hypothetical protein